MELECSTYTIKVSADDLIRYMSDDDFDKIKKEVIAKYKEELDENIINCDYNYDEDGYAFLVVGT